MEKKRNEWVIHIWGKKRETLELTSVESFHLDMLRKYRDQHNKFDLVRVNIAMDELEDKKLFSMLKKEVKSAINNKNIEFTCCQNNAKLGEYVTWKPLVYDRIGEDVRVFYSHFKGYRSYIDIIRSSYPARVVDLCEMFWSYMMYNCSMDFDDVQEKFDSGKSVYCWFVLKCKYDNLDKTLDSYYITYQETLNAYEPKLRENWADDLAKHSPGSFVWYDLKNIGESLKDRPLVTSITDDFLFKVSNEKCGLFTHFCELFLMQFLKEDECYSVNEYGDEWQKLKNNLYLLLYPAKTVGRELIDDFEEYLIDKQLI